MTFWPFASVCMSIHAPEFELESNVICASPKDIFGSHLDLSDDYLLDVCSDPLPRFAYWYTNNTLSRPCFWPSALVCVSIHTPEFGIEGNGTCAFMTIVSSPNQSLRDDMLSRWHFDPLPRFACWYTLPNSYLWHWHLRLAQWHFWLTLLVALTIIHYLDDILTLYLGLLIVDTRTWVKKWGGL